MFQHYALSSYALTCADLLASALIIIIINSISIIIIIINIIINISIISSGIMIFILLFLPPRTTQTRDEEKACMHPLTDYPTAGGGQVN